MLSRRKDSEPEAPASVTNADVLGLEHMRAFVAFVETGSQPAAARRLRVAQPTISRHLERVEAHFGGDLFESDGSRRLSTRGLLVEQSVRAAITELTRTRERLARSGPVLRIGFIRAVRLLVEQALRQQTGAHGLPAFEVHLSELTSDAQARALERRELDIAICYATHELGQRTEVSESLVAEEPFALVVPERAFVRGKPSKRILASLVQARLLERWSPTFARASEAWLAKHGLRDRRQVDCELGSEILAYAGSGFGYGFLPALWSLTNHLDVVFVPVTDFGDTVRIAAYSLQHVTPWVTQL